MSLTDREQFHLERLRDRVQREAAADGQIARPPWGTLNRDSEEGRQRIARELAKFEAWILEGRP